MSEYKFYKKTINGIGLFAETVQEIENMVNALNFIKKHNNVLFDDVKKIEAVIVHPNKGYDTEFFPKQKVWICQSGTILESSVEYMAGLFVHESHHIKQYESGNTEASPKLEKEAYLIQRKFLMDIGDEYSAKWLDEQHEKKWWEDRYIEEEAEKEGFEADTKSNRKIFKELLDLYTENKLELREF